MQVTPRRAWFTRAVVIALTAGGTTFSLTPARSLPEPPPAEACKPHHAGHVPPGCLPAVSSWARGALDQADMLPDLAPLPPRFVRVGPSWDEDPRLIMPVPPDGELVLRFTTSVANVGKYPLEILGEPTAHAESLAAEQCVSWTERVCTKRRNAGQMVFHAEHHHFHFDDFARYDLRLLLSDGTPDWAPSGLLSTSGKVSFCLQDSDAAGPEQHPAVYQGCPGVLQGISPGWADVYAASLPGQELHIADVDDGHYALVYTVDPTNRLAETDETNNVTYGVVEISDGGTAAKVVRP